MKKCCLIWSYDFTIIHVLHISSHSTGCTVQSPFVLKQKLAIQQAKPLKNINYPYIDTMTWLLNNEFGWAQCLPMVIGGSTCVNVAVIRANFGYDQGTTAIFLVLYLNWGWLHHRLFTTQPDHLRVRISCQDRWEGWGHGQKSTKIKQNCFKRQFKFKLRCKSFKAVLAFQS